jgi:RNA polymerase sigma-70 factor (ECF subfamily)
MQDESSILNAFRQGDIDAFETLFRDDQNSVYSWIVRNVHNPAAAEDLTVETFWRIHVAHARFDPSRGFPGWPRRIATHSALDWIRGRRAESEVTIELDVDPTSPVAANPAITAENRCKTAHAFARLPPKLLAAMAGYYLVWKYIVGSSTACSASLDSSGVAAVTLPRVSQPRPLRLLGRHSMAA